jgi:UDP-GlcNAc3NAcA epimerase
MTGRPLKIVTVVGARPQFIKAAPVTRALAAQGLQEFLVHTGQHFDDNMSAVFFEELGIREPWRNLHVGGGNHGQMTARMLEQIEAILLEVRPDWMLVYGDTNSTLAGALAAAKLHIPVAHVEAGLRSFNKRMPEEINRVLTDHVSKLLFCPTSTAVTNLAQEGIRDGVKQTGDVMYDVALAAAQQSKGKSRILERLGLTEKHYAITTVHRAENTDDPAQLRAILAWLKARAADCPLVLPLHPRTRKAIEAAGLDTDGLTLCPPLGYLDMTRLVLGSAAVYTDSGGLQKEAYFHHVPCVTLRDETEWVETVEAGWNRLWQGPDFKARREITEYGDGHAAEKIADSLSLHA